MRISRIPRGPGPDQPWGHVSTVVDMAETRRHERQLEALCSVIEGLSTQGDLGDLVEQALNAVVSLTETDFAALACADADDDRLAYRWTTPVADPATLALLRQPFSAADTMAGAALHAGQAVCMADCLGPGESADPLRHIGAQSGLAHAVDARSRTVLCVVSLTQSCRYTEKAAQLLATIARQIGVVIERDRLIEETRAANRQLDEIIQRNPDAILITDDQGRVCFANPAARRLLARDEHSLRGFPLGLTSQCDSGEIDILRPTGESVPVELHAMETTWEEQRAHVLTLRDLTDRHRVEQEKRASAERIRTALIQTIEAISRTVETRDPYTADHQRRVAVLSREMARTMELDPALVDGVYMGGTIHDIGKLYIPAEILNRPGKLNETEFMLIKTHCAVGRDIIGGIDFPWPLAEMIHQHHERLDGSGYPRGLRGEAILPQARILAIADVVDAMSSRRPYREALGLDAALEEIERGRGSRYDSTAADACVHLFLNQNLRLEDLESAD